MSAFAHEAQFLYNGNASINAQQKQALANQVSNKYGMDANQGMLVQSEQPGLGATRVLRTLHTHNGLRVWQSESVIVADGNGQLLSESTRDLRHGLSKKGQQLAASKAELNTTPKISAQQAIGIASARVAPNGSHIEQPQAELLIYPVMQSRRSAAAANKPESQLNALDMETVVAGYELAYRVKVRMMSSGRPVLFDMFVNAENGQILQQISAMHSVVGSGNAQYYGKVPINTTQSGNQFKMLDPSRGVGGQFGGLAITNANRSSNAGSVYVNSTNNWGDGKQFVANGSTTSANGQTAAVNALWGAMNTYDLLKNVLGWQSLDGRNTATYIAVHVNSNYENAYYSDSCRCMFIGDGANTFYTLSSLDVIGHEMGHGVTAATSNLAYTGESGGLNESASDIIGEMVEAYAKGGSKGASVPAGNDWVMGKEISKRGTPLRYLQKPSKDGSSPDAWNSNLGAMDVHYSSGPNNRMFYFLAQGSNASTGHDAHSSYLTKTPKAMSGIGSDKAFRIWFKALTTKFTSGTNYADARAKMIKTAQELYGAGSKEEIAVTRAYAAINVGADIDEGPVAFGIGSNPENASVQAGASASFSVAGRGGKTPYSYKWYKNNVLINGASGASYSFTATANDNNAQIHAVVTDAAKASATSAKAVLSVTSTPLNSELISNGGFEQGASGWAGDVGVINSWREMPAASGKNNAWMGGNGTMYTENLYQQVTIPVTAKSATLSFMLHINSDEPRATVAADKMTVSVLDSKNAVLKVLATYSNQNKATGYQKRSFDLSAYKGKTIRILFSETENFFYQTSFVLDDVSLIVK
ncbi:M4 family metallopeptidase [Massilia sp. W12]|uniref:M4 family metallopeptidase n=1 Tax=Massilia sp. W12 TaxID=3126507 RepID=UPI0030D5F66E